VWTIFEHQNDARIKQKGVVAFKSLFLREAKKAPAEGGGGRKAARPPGGRRKVKEQTWWELKPNETPKTPGGGVKV